MTDQESKEMRDACIADIQAAMMQPRYYAKVAEIDPRLSEYIYTCADPNTNYSNLYELLGIRKFLRMLLTYPFHLDKVHRIYRAYEHLKFSGMQGRTTYRLTPMQCFQLAAPFGFMRSEDDYRRVVTEANYFVPRKSSKTTLAAFFNFWFFFFEDYNAECYCTANSQQQSKILFDLSRDLIRQMDPEGQDIRFTATEVNWYNPNIRQSKLCSLSAGGRAKDGLFAQLCCADEYGSAGYVKDKSDMASLVNVVEGSMGPRREPMTVITTTAGRVTEGPYEIKLRGIKTALEAEMQVPLDGQPHTMLNDWQFALLCCPDQWEQDDESLQKPEIWNKVNHHISITVQPDFYANEWAKMLQDPEKRKEQVTKLFNVWQSDKVRSWLTAADIRPLQINRTIEDCKEDDGWVTFAGFDFSMGQDLHAISYLSKNVNTGEFFADMSAFIAEEAVNESPIGALYRQWIAGGYLHTCPGRVVTEDIFINKIDELVNAGVFFRAFGFDSYKSKININNLKQYLFNMGVDPDKMVLPISQTIASYTAPVDELDYMIKSNPPFIRFSPNPMWPWEFSCCYLQESTDGINYKPIKSGSKESTKVDNVQALLTALIMYDKINAQIN